MTSVLRRHVRARRTIRIAVLAAIVPAMLITPGRADTPEFGKPYRLGGGSEPEVVVAPDGTIFVDAPQGAPTNHGALWRQNPGASNFTRVSFPSPVNRFPGGGDSAVVVTPGHPNRVYYLDLWLGSNSLDVSDDNGATWTGTPMTTLPPSDRQWIAAGKRDANGNDTVYVSYSQGGILSFTRSTDGGTTWTHYGTISGGLPQGALPHPLLADGDTVMTSFTSAGAMHVAISTDAGATWTIRRASLLNNIPGTIDNMARDGDDLWITYVDFQWQVQVLHSPDLGVTWDRTGYPSQVTDGTGTSIFPWIAARNGKVVISWYEARSASGDPNAVDAPWDVMYSEVTGRDEYGDLVFTQPFVAAAAAKASGGVCTMGIGCQKDRDLGDFQSIALDPNGKAVIAYVGGGQVQVVKQN